MSGEKDVNARLVRKSSDFVERLAVAVVVAFPNDGSIFVIDFLKPSLDLIVNEEGRVTGHRGDLELTARILLPPVTCKKLLKALEDAVKKYEDKFGKIPEKEKEVK